MTGARMLLAPAVAWWILDGRLGAAGAGLFVAGFLDWADGVVARRCVRGTDCEGERTEALPRSWLHRGPHRRAPLDGSKYAVHASFRSFNQGSLLGTFLDPLADKVLLASTSLALGYTVRGGKQCGQLWHGRLRMAASPALAT